MPIVTSLDSVKEGAKAIVRGFRDEHGWVRRLNYMGIIPGTQIEVLVNRGSGPLVLRVERGTEVCIGRGLARKIIVEVPD